jgi:cytidine deaminase
VDNRIAVRQLYDLAIEARQRSWSPYSGFAVGAAVETVDGTRFAGCNVENAAYGLSLCAEQVAIAKAVSEGHCQLRRVLVVARPLASPCGACRQVIGEFMAEDGLIYACEAGDFSCQKSWTLAELLPDRFRLSPEGPGDQAPLT